MLFILPGSFIPGQSLFAHYLFIHLRMLLKLLPVIDVMIGLYQQPATPERFQTYLKILEGDGKGSFAFPVSGFNPMAKGHILEKLHELKALGAERIMQEVINELNIKFADEFPGKEFNVALNLSDDLKGGWTNRFTSDYDSKFRFSGFFNRNFCVPVWWSSEQLTKEIIKRRTAEYILRTVYRISHPIPLTLHQHLIQESFVAHALEPTAQPDSEQLLAKESFYSLHKDSTQYAVIFNFFYGDTASETLAFPVFGNDDAVSGFDFAATRKFADLS
jgi:hypothetical protein